jgi:endo-1,4-beta-mannosidase
LKVSPPRARLLTTALLGVLSSGCVASLAQVPLAAGPKPASFFVDGEPLCFAGANNYASIYQPKPLVDDVLDAAQALHLKVMRIWGMLDRGSLDGSVPNADAAGHKSGVYFQYWDPQRGRPAYNDGPDGLERLDYVLAAAAKRDIKLIVVLLNNWRAFGGIDQYLMWYGLSRHHEFFSAPQPRQAYRDWAEHVIMRKNSVNGRRYRDDPTIFAWELANEPRCKNASSFDSNEGWDTRTLVGWAAEMSGYLKSLDPNHLVAVGDEGFLNEPQAHWAYRAVDGVDHAALTALPNVDFGTFHLYPDDWRVPQPFAEQWIIDHVDLARRLGKPTILEEYGLRDLQQRPAAYARWNDTLLRAGGNASLAWMLAGTGYPDFDGFAFHRDDATGKLLAAYAQVFQRAPACGTQANAATPVSSFVSVRPPAERVADGWLVAD